ncbi:MAG: hypothetical protein SVP52_08490 [Chloroflexota bacterium]|nr:hypothetical protein [Chloroflexota bacterium]
MTRSNRHPFKHNGFFGRMILLLILPLFVIGCNFPTTKNTVRQDQSQSLEVYSTPFINVEFNAILPEPLSDGEKVSTVILDEVTGLPHNRQPYQMTESDPLLYTTTLLIPKMSVVKYRYEKTGTENLPETKPGDQDFRYRMIYAEGDLTVDDLIFSWADDKTNYEKGRFEGVVFDQDTGDPIPDILINAGGIASFSDANGFFVFDDLPVGTHNVLFYAIDGKYQTHQQGAVIVSDRTTPATIKLSQNDPVEVTFVVSPPGEASGAPIYIAGNLMQFGNTFSDLQGAMSIETNRLPLLTPQPDGKLTKTMTLYAGTDLRFKFTLGDGYWNAEQKTDGGIKIRQLILPDHDFSLELQIETWRTSVFEPISFETFVHPTVGQPGERYIQIKTDEWTKPLPMWPIGNGNYLYILFSPFEMASPITYRVCLESACDSTTTTSLISPEAQVEPKDQPITQTITVDPWLIESNQEPYLDIYHIPFPYKPVDFKTIIEFSPEMTPAWSTRLPIGLEEIQQINASTLVFSPRWFQNGNLGVLHPVIGKTPFYYELIGYIEAAQEKGFEVSLFPQMEPLTYHEDSSGFSNERDAWQQAWFNAYRRFILNYAKIAEISGSKYLIIGGNPLPSTFANGYLFNDGDQFEDEWQDLIAVIRKEYQGKLVWASNAGTELDPLPPFIESFDEIYISIDSPLYDGTNASFDQIAYGFTRTIDNLVYEVYRSTLKPVTLALAYPSVNGATNGCHLISEDCKNDGLFLKKEVSGYSLDLIEQAEIYNAILPIAASREWITGISIRGYAPAGTPDDLTSSIAGKPAKDVIKYWYTGLRDN